MRYIVKDDKEPSFLVGWRNKNQKRIDELTNDANKTGTHIWAFLRENKEGDKVYNELKNHLLKEQGHICCYCGTKIFNDGNTRIEHVLPKSVARYRTKIFDYYNLMASCQGGSKNTIHVVKQTETVESIALKYEVSVEWLESVYVFTENIDKICKDYDLDDIKIGDRILIFPKNKKSKELHCDNRKDSYEIGTHPLQVDCLSKFTYTKESGKVNTKNENDNITKDTITKLGLNDNPSLCEQRLLIANEAINKRDALSKISNLSDRNKILIGLRKKYGKIDGEHLPSLAFVTYSVLLGN